MSDSPLKDYMTHHSIPTTRQNFLEINHMGKPPAQLSPEEESEMPEEMKLPVKEEEEGMPNPPADMGPSHNIENAPLTKPNMEMRNTQGSGVVPNPLIPREQ